MVFWTALPHPQERKDRFPGTLLVSRYTTLSSHFFGEAARSRMSHLSAVSSAIPQLLFLFRLRVYLASSGLFLRCLSKEASAREYRTRPQTAAGYASPKLTKRQPGKWARGDLVKNSCTQQQPEDDSSVKRVV